MTASIYTERGGGDVRVNFFLNLIYTTIKSASLYFAYWRWGRRLKKKTHKKTGAIISLYTVVMLVAISVFFCFENLRYIKPKSYKFGKYFFNFCTQVRTWKHVFCTIGGEWIFHVFADGRTWQAFETRHALSIWDDYATGSGQV